MAADLNITLEQYASYTLLLTITNADSTPKVLTGHTGEFKIAKRSDKAKVFEIDGINGTVSFPDAVNGEVKIFIKEVTLAPLSSDNSMTIDPTDYFFTFKIIETATGIKTRVLDGLVSVAPGIV